MRIICRSFFFLVILSLLFSCRTEPRGTDSSDRNAELSIRLKRDPAKLNPMTYPSTLAREVHQYILVPLADFDPVSLQLRPILIKDIPVAQPITEGVFKGGEKYTIEFLPEAKWDNGKPITAEDYLFTIKTIKNEQIDARGWRAYFEDLVDIIIDPENDRKFDVILKKPYMLAVEALVTANLFPKHIYDPNNATNILSVDGTVSEEGKTLDSTFVKNFNGVVHSREIVEGAGPYKLTGWETDQFLTLERKENYWASNSNNPFLQALPQTIIFKIVPEELSALTLLESGDINVMTGVSSANFKKLKSKSAEENKYNFHTPQLIFYYYLLANNEDKILADANVRKALAYLTNVDQMISNFENGNATPQVGHFHPTKTYYNDRLKPIGYDLEIAKSLLNKSGWLDSDDDGLLDKVIDGKKMDLDLDILISKSELGRKVSLMLQSEAKKIGVNIELVTKSGGEIRADTKSGNYQLNTAAVRQGANADDPYARWHSEGASNFANYSNKKVDALIDELRLITSPEDRDAIYKKIQEEMYDDVPSIFLYSPKERIIVSKNISATVTPKRPGYLANTFATEKVALEK